MGKKDKILVKLNIKDYTNSLEKILDKKEFSTDTKNLLLSMLYKIENGYNDYSKTKVEVPSKNDFLENIFNIIESKCNEIIVAEFDSEASKTLKEQNVKYIIDKENKKIIVFGNELLILNCILEMAEEEIVIPGEKQDMQLPISNFLNLGNKMNKLEVIRDFNGWSWDIVLKEINDINVNLLFQTLITLTGYKFVDSWINNKSNLADYLELLKAHLRENYGEKRATQFVNTFNKLVIDTEISKNEEQYKFWQQKKKSLEQELINLQDKQKYLEQKTKDKKNYLKQIEDIDKILNNKELLKKEYTKRNEKLPNKEKIFSISHLVERLNNERDELLVKIKECNNLIDPKGYVERKQKVEEDVNFLRQLDINKKQDIKETLVNLCSIFLECLQIKIAKAQIKQEVIDYIYELRYFSFLPINKDGTILKNIDKLKSIFKKTRKALLKKARELNAIDFVTEDEDINEKIINNIFDSKMIDLDHMVIETRVTDGKLFAEYYDENVLETVVEVNSDKTVRLKKKTKLFL